MGYSNSADDVYDLHFSAILITEKVKVNDVKVDSGKHWPNAVLMLVQRRRRWTNIKINLVDVGPRTYDLNLRIIYDNIANT